MALHIKWVTGVDNFGVEYWEWRYKSGGRAGRAPSKRLALHKIAESFGLTWASKLSTE
jgi:hypothetical protein